MDALEFRDVRVSLGGRIILEDVNLQIGPREFVGVLGANGSGKTTLLRAALGLIPLDRGSITVLGEAATRGNPNVGYLPQFHGASSSSRLRGWDFVASVIRGNHLGLPVLSRVDRSEVDRALDLVSAGALARRPLSELSGGERQRLLLAQALIGNPRLLLLDEPLVGLDPHHQDEVVRLVRQLQQQLGITVLFSAHELNPLLDCIDRVLYLGNGHVALGTVDEVITGPVLSRLYGSQIDVVRVNGRVFVMSGGFHIEHHDHAAPVLEEHHHTSRSPHA
jgi:zinc/manganese transport system ATP-binding protein